MPAAPITYERVKDWWAKDLPVSKGQWNFDEIRFVYFRDRVPAFEAFKAGAARLLARSQRQVLGHGLSTSTRSSAASSRRSGCRSPRSRRCRPSPSTPAARSSRTRACAGLQPGVRLRVGQQEPVLRPVHAARQLLRQFGAEGAGPAGGSRARDPERGQERGAAGGLHRGMEESGQRHARGRAQASGRWRPSCSPRPAGSPRAAC